MTIECPECAAGAELRPDAMAGEVLQCPDCGVELEVISVSPPQVELAPTVEEDWGE
ncbi:MAG: lysine biosynthesis protein LysW [Phycisphaeraceae bacterium]|nr:MAG: lysine biosynthesis protein LysW [Phycisphaeraceae bacterium]